MYFVENGYLFQIWWAEDYTIGLHIAHLFTNYTNDIWSFKTDQTEMDCKNAYLVNHKVLIKLPTY
jgi:hypothetical protein